MAPQRPESAYWKVLIAGAVGIAVVTLAIMVATRGPNVAEAPSASQYPRASPRPSVASSAARANKKRKDARDAASATTPAGAAPLFTELLVPRAQALITADGETDDDGWHGAIARTGAFTDATGQNARPYSDARFVWGDAKLYVILYAADEDIRTAGSVSDGADSFHLVFDDGKIARAIDVSPLGVVSEGSRASSSPASSLEPLVSPSAGPALAASASSHAAATSSALAHPISSPAAGAASSGLTDPSFSMPWKSGVVLGHDLDGTLNDPKDEDEEWVIEMAIPLASLGLQGQPGEKIGLSISRCDKPKDAPRTCEGWGRPSAALPSGSHLTLQ